MDNIQIVGTVISVAVGYVLGSVPFAYLIGRAHGTNVLEVGTSNPGAANVFRTVGRRSGALVFTADVLKGFSAVGVANLLGVEQEASLAAGAAAVVGHWYPVFLRFRGGVGLATAIGAGVALTLLPGAVGLALGVSMVAIIRNTGYGAGIGYAGFVVLGLFMDVDRTAMFGATGLGLAVLVRGFFRRAEPKALR